MRGLILNPMYSKRVHKVPKQIFQCVLIATERIESEIDVAVIIPMHRYYDKATYKDLIFDGGVIATGLTTCIPVDRLNLNQPLGVVPPAIMAWLESLCNDDEYYNEKTVDISFVKHINDNARELRKRIVEAYRTLSYELALRHTELVRCIDDLYPILPEELKNRVKFTVSFLEEAGRYGDKQKIERVLSFVKKGSYRR